MSSKPAWVTEQEPISRKPKLRYQGCGVIAQFPKGLPCKPEHPRLVLKNLLTKQKKKNHQPVRRVQSGAGAGEAEAGGPLLLLPRQPNLFGEVQVSERS